MVVWRHRDGGKESAARLRAVGFEGVIANAQHYMRQSSRSIGILVVRAAEAKQRP